MASCWATVQACSQGIIHTPALWPCPLGTQAWVISHVCHGYSLPYHLPWPLLVFLLPLFRCSSLHPSLDVSLGDLSCGLSPRLARTRLLPVLTTSPESSLDLGPGRTLRFDQGVASTFHPYTFLTLLQLPLCLLWGLPSTADLPVPGQGGRRQVGEKAPVSPQGQSASKVCSVSTPVTGMPLAGCSSLVAITIELTVVVLFKQSGWLEVETVILMVPRMLLTS